MYHNHFLPINHFEPCVFVYKHGLSLVKNLKKLKDKDIIDAGAFIGDSACIFTKYTRKKIYSFEPMPENFALLKKVICMNDLNNVIPVNKALSQTIGTLDFRTPNSVSSSSSCFKLHGINYQDHIECVECTTLDHFVEENNIIVGLIKTDLEGGEFDFLQGAERTIKKFRPTMLLSIYHKPEDFFYIKTTIEGWNLGYKFKIFNPIDKGILLETMLICECI